MTKNAMRRLTAAMTVVLGGLAAQSATACPLFADDFEDGADPAWGNEFGDWSATDGTYNAAIPDNLPNSHSTVPFVLSDLSVDVDINNAVDGGVWVHCEEARTPIGVRGVLLVLAGSQVYWHIVQDSYGPILNSAGGLYQAGDDVHVRIEVIGNTYTAYLNGAATPATTLETDEFPSGRVGLYDFGNQTFDNFELRDEFTCIADLNADEAVNAADLAALLAAWGSCDACDADFNCDGVVDAADLASLLAAWGPCGD